MASWCPQRLLGAPVARYARAMTETRERAFRCTCCDPADGEPRLMHQYGTRAELVALLRGMATDWFYLCKDKLSLAATDGANGLENGSFAVKVGHTMYSVDETGDAGHNGE